MTAAVADLHKNKIIQGQITSQSRSTRPTEMLLALPLEMQQEIIPYLTNSGDPGLADLRAVNRHFHSIITHDTLFGHGIALVAHGNLKTADRLCETTDSHAHCVLIPAERFHWNSRKKSLGGKRRYTRFCMGCGIKYRRIGAGNSVKVDNEGDNYRIVCSMCFEFLVQPPELGSCPEHWQRRYMRKDHSVS